MIVNQRYRLSLSVCFTFVTLFPNRCQDNAITKALLLLGTNFMAELANWGQLQRRAYEMDEVEIATERAETEASCHSRLTFH